MYVPLSNANLVGTSVLCQARCQGSKSHCLRVRHCRCSRKRECPLHPDLLLLRSLILPWGRLHSVFALLFRPSLSLISLTHILSLFLRRETIVRRLIVLFSFPLHTRSFDYCFTFWSVGQYIPLDFHCSTFVSLAVLLSRPVSRILTFANKTYIEFASPVCRVRSSSNLLRFIFKEAMRSGFICVVQWPYHS